MLYRSKTLGNITYSTSKIALNYYLTVKYKDRILVSGSSYPIKVRLAIKEIESYISNYADLLEDAYTKTSKRRTDNEEFDLRWKLLKTLQTYRK